MSEWQPIETAPKDGKFAIYFNGTNMRILNRPKNCALGIWKKIGKKWYGAIERFDNPTHWMPLPEPPTKE